MIKTVKDNSLINEHNRNNNVAWLTNISSCIWLSKVTDILEKTIDNTEIRKRCVNILNEKVKQISSFKIVDVKKFKKIFNCYTYHYLNCKIGSARQFMVDCSNNNISRYFKVKYIGSKRQKSQRGNKSPKNIIMDFNSDYFAKQTGRYEDIPLYPTCYCHYFMLAFLLNIMTTGEMVLPKYRKNNSFYKKFLTILFENLNSSVLTGLEAYSEYELSYPYCCVYDELRKLTSAYQDKLVFSATLHNKSFEATIKDYSLITEMFAKFRGAWTDKDVGQIIPNPSSKSGKYKITSNDVIQIHKDEHDQISGVFSKIRITEGSEGNKIIVHKNIITNSKPLEYIMFLHDYPLKKKFISSLISSNAINSTLRLSTPKRDTKKKDVRGDRTYIFYDKTQELHDKAKMGNITPKFKLTDKETKYISQHGGWYMKDANYLNISGLNLLRCELQYKYQEKIQSLQKFLNPKSKQDSLTVATIIDLLQKKVLYSKLNEYYVKELQDIVFYKLPNEQQVELTSYKRAFADLIDDYDSTTLELLYKSLGLDNIYKDNKATLKRSNKPLYSELYQKIILGQNT